jgi:NADPH:quinone reductase-like Zn-dependent oxidoreductase
MKASFYEKFGAPEVLQFRDVEKPAPQPNEVLIKVFASGVTKFDCWMRSCTSPPGFGLFMRLSAGIKPKQPILGTELSGEIEAVGEDVTRFAQGNQVFGFTGMKLGAHAEYICLPEDLVAIKPANTTHTEAAGVLQGALTALYFLRKSRIQRGQKVLVFGASGGVGGYAVQLAKHHFGAEVTGVCSASKMAYVKSLGADTVLDYTREDFTQNGEVYDIIFDTVGKTSVSRTQRSLTEGGYYLLATFGLPMLIQLLWYSKIGGKNYEFGLLEEKAEDMIFLKNLVEAGEIKAVIDKSYPLEQAAEAHRYVESGQKMGNVILTMGNAS